MKKKLKKLFERGAVLDPLRLLGKDGNMSEWSVHMLTGPVLDLGFLRHRKRFCFNPVSERVEGYNVLGRDRYWGYFVIRKGDSSTPTTIDYDDSRNGFSQVVVDEVRATDYDGLVVGRFCVRLFGKKRFVGYFTMRRWNDCILN